MEFQILTQGERIKRLRKELNINQDELGGAKFSKNYISMFENNKRQINAINAAFLARRINEIAKSKNRTLDITASYFLKTEEDLAKDKCMEWIDEVRNNYELTTYRRISILNKIIHISEKFNLRYYYAEGLFLKGIDLLNRKLYYCATTIFLECVNVFLEQNNYEKVAKAYKYIAILFYDQEKFSEALLYFNTAHNIINHYHINDNNLLQEILYYKSCL